MSFPSRTSLALWLVEALWVAVSVEPPLLSTPSVESLVDLWLLGRELCSSRRLQTKVLVVLASYTLRHVGGAEKGMTWLYVFIQEL